MSFFKLYFELGVTHITDFNGYDHLLFLAVLCALHTPQQWKKVVGLVTAFTIGHSITLALATMHIIDIPTTVVEWLIALTIAITALFNMVQLYATRSTQFATTNYRYAATLVFGLIHGLGFSTYLRSLLGDEQTILAPLLCFNIGVEAGQLIIVVLFFILLWLWLLVRLPIKAWQTSISLLGFAVSFWLLVQRYPFAASPM